MFTYHRHLPSEEADFPNALGDWYGSITAAKVISLLSVVIVAVAYLLLTQAAGRSSQLWNGCAAIMNSVFMAMWSCRSMFIFC